MISADWEPMTFEERAEILARSIESRDRQLARLNEVLSTPVATIHELVRKEHSGGFDLVTILDQAQSRLG
jgi:hypothetical protein